MVFDALVVLFVAIVAGIGAWRGFARLLGAVAAPVAGIAAGWPLSAGLAPHLTLRAPLDRWVAFAILYLLITLVVFLLALAVRKALERAQLGSWDRHLGFALGAVKGFVLAIVLTAAALAFSQELRPQVRATHAGGLMSRAVRSVRPVLPRAASDLLAPWLDLLDQREKA